MALELLVMGHTGNLEVPSLVPTVPFEVYWLLMLLLKFERLPCVLIIAWFEDYRPNEAIVALEPPLLIG